MNTDLLIAQIAAAISVVVWLFLCQREHIKRKRERRERQRRGRL